jgi:hypothetical protein
MDSLRPAVVVAAARAKAQEEGHARRPRDAVRAGIGTLHQ